MAFVLSSQMSDAEAEGYMRVFHATVNVLTNSMVVFDARRRSDPDPKERERYQAGALAANRDLRLVQAKLQAFMVGQAMVRAPTAGEVSTAQELTAKLAAELAAQAKAAALVKITSKAFATFSKINEPATPAAPAAPTPPPPPPPAGGGGA